MTPIQDIVVVRKLRHGFAEGTFLRLVDSREDGEPYAGLVLAVGPGRWLAKTNQPRRKPMQCRPGDVVLFYRSVGMVSKWDGVPVLVMRDGNIEAVIDGQTVTEADFDDTTPPGRITSFVNR